jgi:uncharacterized protein (DUF885 family)
MYENSPLDMGNITTEVERYAAVAGQATTYKIGMQKILDLRADARDRLGDEFDIKGYHQVILENGMLPLYVLEEVVNEWVEAELNK